MENKKGKIKDFIVHYRNPKGSIDDFILFYGTEQSVSQRQPCPAERALPAYSQKSACNQGAEDPDMICQQHSSHSGGHSNDSKSMKLNKYLASVHFFLKMDRMLNLASIKYLLSIHNALKLQYTRR